MCFQQLLSISSVFTVDGFSTFFTGFEKWNSSHSYRVSNPRVENFNFYWVIHCIRIKIKMLEQMRQSNENASGQCAKITERCTILDFTTISDLMEDLFDGRDCSKTRDSTLTCEI
jgi:hypothetical protein